MWGGGFDGGDFGGETRLDAGFLEGIIKRHTIGAALVGIALSVGFFLLAYYLPALRRLVVVTVLLLVISLPLLVLGLVKKAVQTAQGPLRCPRCGASEREEPGFERVHPKSVSYDVVRCKSCEAEWIDRK